MRTPLLPTFSFHNTAHQLTVAIIIVSVLFGLLSPLSFAYGSFIPGRVWGAIEIWRPFTALLVAENPMEVIFGGLIVYSMGGSIEAWWGKTRFLMVALGIPLVGMFLTVVLSMLLPTTVGRIGYTGASSIITSLWIMYGLIAEFSGRSLNFWGTPLKGRTFALIGLGFVILSGAMGSFYFVLPSLFTAALAYSYMYNKFTFNLFERAELLIDKMNLARLKAKRRGKKSSPFTLKRGGNDSGPQIH